MASVKVPEQKVILCGEFGVGKSSLFRRFATNSFVTATDRQSTLGLDHFDKEYKVGGKEIRLWDTGGMERVASITSSYYKFAEAAILVFSLDNPASFHVLSQHLEQCHNLISATYKTSCKTGQGVEEMFGDIAQHLVESNRSRLELQAMDTESFKITPPDEATDPTCLC
ncbi:hypothetical protein C0J52_14265 [Blattella germanica]|nr:hypothetical protein C0J52_14265 [Blattella germanica]